MNDKKQSEKLLHVQASEVYVHINNKDYGLAETKAKILWSCLIEISQKKSD